MTGEVDWSKEVLTFRAKTDTTFTVKYSNGGTGELQYSLDNGNTWTVVTHDTSYNINSFVTPTVSAGATIQWKGNFTCPGNTGTTGLCFWSSNNYEVYGNIMSLMDETLTEPSTLPSGCFAKLFDKRVINSSLANNNIISAKNLILPSITSTYCYDSMFYGCTNLSKAPQILPGTTAQNYCYEYMFYGCTHLYNPPTEIAATSYGTGSCQYMFYNCTYARYYPIINATTVASKSCYYMFYYFGCNSSNTTYPALKNPPHLPATTLAIQCYQHMFRGDTKLTNLDNLFPVSFSIPSGASNCCASMFYGCTGITNAGITLAPSGMSQSCFNEFLRGCTALTIPPILPNTSLGTYCYKSMFYGCTKLVNGPILPALTLTQQCYSVMFNGCTKLANIKMMATDISATDCLKDWMKDVGSTGTFTKNAAATWNVTGASGVPTGWTIQTATS